jgi:hypothetical protein
MWTDFLCNSVQVSRDEDTLDQSITAQLPKYVFAVRGTIFPRGEDIKSDVHIVVEVLHEYEGKRMTRLLRAIKNKYGHQNICVAGHSLGAALALIATRSIAIEDGVVINTHLFNPPYLTVGRLVSKAVRGVLNGVGDLGDSLVCLLGLGNTGIVRAATDTVANACKSVKAEVLRLEREMDTSSTAEKMKEESRKLLGLDYVPNLYLNPEDLICNEYIQHFQRGIPVYASYSSECMDWFLPCRSLHMIPKAVLHINHRGKGMKEAHKLHQWFKFPHVNLRVEEHTIPSEFIGSSQPQDGRLRA